MAQNGNNLSSAKNRVFLLKEERISILTLTPEFIHLVHAHSSSSIFTLLHARNQLLA